MDRNKVKKMMAESVLIRETAVESFTNSIGDMSFKEATKHIKSLGAENLSELKAKILEGDILVESVQDKVEELAESLKESKKEMNHDKEEEIKESMDEEEPKKEAAEEEEEEPKKEAAEEEDDDSLMEKLVVVIESLGKRLTKLESVENGEEPKSGEVPTKEKSEDDVVDGEEPKSGKMPEAVDDSDDAKSDEEEKEENPKPPVVKEGFTVQGYDLDIRAEKLTNISSKRFDNLFR